MADSHNHAIRLINIYASTVETIAGTGKCFCYKLKILMLNSGEEGFNGDFLVPLSTTFNNPMGVCFQERNIIVADTNNHRVRVIDVNNRYVSTIAGSFLDGDSGDEGLASKSLLNSPHDVRYEDNVVYIAGMFQVFIVQVSNQFRFWK